jgi:undecaprenyl-phosphate 4-deoxy-4-formamido-L-arabinose transferase
MEGQQRDGIRDVTAGRPSPPLAGPAVDVSVVIPCYRDEAGMAQIFDRLGPVLDEICERPELVLVEDGSPDRTGAVAIQLAQTYRHPTTVVRLQRNFGQHAAVFAGFEHARGAVIVTMDSDLQYLPEEIPLLLAELSPEYKVVAGLRLNRRDPFPRNLITKGLTWWIGRRTGTTIKDYGSMFRAYDRSVVDQLLLFQERRRLVTALVAWLGVPVKEVPVTHEERGAGGSRYRLGALVDMLMDLLTGYSTFPLRLVTVTALLAALAGFAATLGLALYRVVVGSGGAGAVSAFALLFLLVTVQLVLTAIVGEYIGRVYVEVKERPHFLVRDVVRNEPAT